MAKHSMFRRYAALTVLVMFLAATSAAQAPNLPDPGNPGISKQEQIQVGQKAVGEVYKQMPVLPDSSPVTQYVQQLGRKLERVIPQQYGWPYEFHVIEQKEINAFALPGGPIFVNVGTITAADNEAELAGVMAHEMSHVYMQHSAKQMRQNTGPSILAGVGQILGSMIGGVGGAVASIGGQMVGGMLSMKYSRADEAQADSVGAIIMYKSNYDPKAMAEFFQKLEKEGGGGGPQFLSDHPNPGNRVAAVEKEIAGWPRENWVTNSQSFTKVRQQAQGIKAYTAQQIADGAKSGQWAQQNQKSGAVPSNVSMTQGGPGSGGAMAPVDVRQVAPSGRYKQLNNNVFSMKYPDNWQTMQDQQSGGLTIAPQAGVSGNAIAYGVVIGAAQGNGSLDASTQQLIGSLVQSNPGLKQSGGAQNIRINGAAAKSADLMGNSPIADQSGKSLREHDWLVTAQRSDGSMLYLVFISPERDFEQLRPTYENMLRTLRVK